MFAGIPISQHWLPSIVANPTLAINPGQMAALQRFNTSVSAQSSNLQHIAENVRSSLEDRSAITSQSQSQRNLTAEDVPGGSVEPESVEGRVESAVNGTIPSTLSQSLSNTLANTSAINTPSQTQRHLSGGIQGVSAPDASTTSTRAAAGGAVLDAQMTTKDRSIPISPSAPPTGIIGFVVPSAVVTDTVIPSNSINLSREKLSEGLEKEEDRIIQKVSDARKNRWSEVESTISPKGIIFNITIQTVIISALVFVLMLTWFEFVRAVYDETFSPGIGGRNINEIITRFWYAIFITCLVIVFVYGIYKWSKYDPDTEASPCCTPSGKSICA